MTDEFQKDFFKNPKIEEIDMGTEVICDGPCGANFMFKDDEGGFLFGSKAYCPNCAKAALPDIKKYGEESYIKAYCPPGVSFWMWVLRLRKSRGGNVVRIITESLDEKAKI